MVIKNVPSPPHMIFFLIKNNLMSNDDYAHFQLASKILMLAKLITKKTDMFSVPPHTQIFWP